MTTFLAYSTVLLLIALLFVIVPVWRFRPASKSVDADIRRQKNIEVFKQSLAELGSDRVEHEIDDEEYDKLKIELERSFLRDMEDEDKRERGAGTRASKLVPLLCLLFVPVFSYSLYNMVGSARDLALTDIMAGLSNAESAEEQEAGLNRLADFLQARFDRDNEDIQNGYMLGTLYLELQDYDKAIPIFKTLAEQLDPSEDKATVLGQLAQAEYLAADSQMSDEVRQVMNEALSMNPNEYAVLSILAIEAVLQENLPDALGYWRRQLMQLDSGSQQANALRARIAQVEALLGVDAGNATAQAAESASVTLDIDIDDAMRSQVDDSMTLYVYARRPGGGPPVAARNMSVQDFPLQITLDDSNAMMPGNNLSSASEIYVGARLSRTGNALAQPGDIQGESAPFMLADQDEPVHLVIDEVVQ